MLPDSQHAVALAAYPHGPVRLADLEVVRIPVVPPGAGELLIRNDAFLVAPSIRPLLSASAQPESGVPYPPVRVGDVLGAATVGRVVVGTSGMPVGSHVLHFRGWREFTTVPATECQLVTSALDPIWQLGHGFTAYAALTRGAPVRSGDVVFVGSAGGAIGSMCAQIARLLGARRVLGSTSSTAKAARIVAELGYDAVVARANGELAEQLASLAPDGLDVIIDTVGGDQLQAALALVRDGGRVALIGTLQQDLAMTDTTVRFDAHRFLAKRVTMRGYSSDDDAALIPEWDARALGWHSSGAVHFPHELIRGIDAAPRALVDASAGCFLGAVVVQLTNDLKEA
jgi:NADPH-dependent curcumin reductase CurA